MEAGNTGSHVCAAIFHACQYEIWGTQGFNEMDDTGEKVRVQRTIALRDLLMHGQVAHKARLAGLAARRTDQHAAGPGDEMDAAGEHAEAATNAV